MNSTITKNINSFFLAEWGLCFESICKNGECADYKKVVLINMGFGIFKIGMPSD